MSLTNNLFFRSIKRKFEQELSEIETLNEHLKTSENKKELLTPENIQNANNLLNEYFEIIRVWLTFNFFYVELMRFYYKIKNNCRHIRFKIQN